MSELKEEFLFLVLTSPVTLGDMTAMLAGLAEHTATWAAWQNGVRGVSFGVSLPALLSGGLAQSASLGSSTSSGTAHSTGQAHTDSQAHSTGSAHTTGSADTSGWSHVVGDSLSKSSGVAVSKANPTRPAMRSRTAAPSPRVPVRPAPPAPGSATPTAPTGACAVGSSPAGWGSAGR